MTELRTKHANGERNAGVSIKQGGVKNDIGDENVLQPLLVSTSAIELASETVKMVSRIIHSYSYNAQSANTETDP